MFLATNYHFENNSQNRLKHVTDPITTTTGRLQGFSKLMLTTEKVLQSVDMLRTIFEKTVDTLVSHIHLNYHYCVTFRIHFLTAEHKRVKQTGD